MAYVRLAPFDRARDFVAQRGFKYLGVDYQKGDPFPKEQASTRSLRLLYDSRAIGYADAQRGPEPLPKAPLANLRTRKRPAARDPLDHDGDGRKGGAVPAQTKVADDAPLDTEEQRKAYELGHTKAELTAILKKAGVTIDRKWNKAELVAEIARARYGASGR